MDDTLRVCLFSRSDPKEGTPFASAFDKLPNLETVNQCSTWEELEKTLTSVNVALVAVDLRAGDQLELRVVERIRQLPRCVGVIGVGKATDPQAIIKAMRAGCGQYVVWPVDIEDLKQAIDRMQSTPQVVSSVSKRFCVVGSSGGSGATTVACNLAMEVAHLSERRCALVDMNLEYGDICCAFDANPKFTIADVCRDPREMDRTLLRSALEDLPCNVSLLARPRQVKEVGEVTEGALARMFGLLEDLFTNVVVDLPRSASYLSAVTVANADRILIVTQLTVPSIRNATRLYDCLMQMGADERAVEIVLNRYNANFGRITMADVEKHFSRPVFATIPNDYRSVAAALDLGHPIGADAPTSPARKAIREMAHKILADGTPLSEVRGRGIFSRIWTRKQKQS